jgi:uncharacterized membrane protein YphA (DoxX/SURF4 family)
MADHSRIPESAYWALKIGLGATAFLAGADKFTNRMVNWDKYLSPAAERALPVSGRNFMRLAGVIEMGVGALILGKQTRLGSYIASAWLLGIAANLVTGQDYYDIAARDVNMAVGAYTLGRLAEARATGRAAERPTRRSTVVRTPQPVDLTQAPLDLRDEPA